MKDALLAAGERLAEALRLGLIAQGFPGEVNLQLEDGRIRVFSKSQEVRIAEFGRAGSPPTAPLETMARAAAPEVFHALRSRVEEALQ